MTDFLLLLFFLDVPPITKAQQAGLIYDALNIPENKRRVISLPLQIFDVLIGLFSFLERFFEALQQHKFSEKFGNGAEIARIVHYYATEPMVAIGENEVKGTVRLKDHFDMLAKRG